MKEKILISHSWLSNLSYKFLSSVCEYKAKIDLFRYLLQPSFFSVTRMNVELDRMSYLGVTSSYRIALQQIYLSVQIFFWKMKHEILESSQYTAKTI